MRQEQNSSFGGFSFSPQEIARVLGSPEGRQLLQLLQRDGGERLRAAASAAAAGNTEQAKSIVAPVMESPEAQELIRKINGGR